MTDPIEVQLGVVYDATLLKMIDAQYAIVEIEHDGVLVTTMFEYGAIKLFPGYEGVWQRDVDTNFVLNGIYKMKVVGYNKSTNLPQITFLDSKSKACETFAIEEGWAYPQQSHFEMKTIHRDYKQSLIAAYKNKKGAWGDIQIQDEYGVTLTTELGILPTELRLTYFQAHKGISIVVFVILAVFVAEYMSKQRAMMQEEMEESNYGIIRRSLWKLFNQHKRTFFTTKKQTQIDGHNDEPTD